MAQLNAIYWARCQVIMVPHVLWTRAAQGPRSSLGTINLLSVELLYWCRGNSLSEVEGREQIDWKYEALFQVQFGRKAACALVSSSTILSSRNSVTVCPTMGTIQTKTLHSVEAQSHVLVVRWIARRGGEAAQLGLFKREMDRGSEQGTNIPLQRAHGSASICTPLSLPPIHHSHTASTSCFHPNPIFFSLTCLIPECEGDSAVS